jgi:N-acetylglucosaminyldiphosphoundecaprenol N-acetyl-beta-D-mannosaminyltransferase
VSAINLDHLDKVNVLGVGITVLNLPLAVACVSEALRTRHRGYVCVTGVHGVMEAQHDPHLRRILNQALLCTPDGMPNVWMGKLAGHKSMGRVYGPDLMLEVCRLPNCRHFFYGGSHGTVGELKLKLEAQWPALQVAGLYEPPWRPLTRDEERAFVALVDQTRPDILWVGLSTPKQEKFMADYLPKLNVTLMIGVGAAFDMHSGRKRQAPRWVQRCGLEWCYRLCQEPRRLGPRYLANNPRFVWKALGQLLRLKRYS